MTRLRHIARRAREAVRKVVRAGGFDIIRMGTVGSDPFADMRHFLGPNTAPIIFDVGANVGQSVDLFRAAFPAATIHSFEPSPSTFAQLEAHCARLPGVHTWNYGVGSRDATAPFTENSQSVMSSFLAPSSLAWGEVVQTTDVKVVTLDSFARDQQIAAIDVLKSDTQGFELEVFKGAGHLLSSRIKLIYFEIIFSDMYKDLPAFDEVFRYLTDHNFVLVTFYRSAFQQELVSWTDALFINRDYYREHIARAA